MGNLTRDPELRVTPKGTSIASFALAINRDWKSESGEKQTEVTFVDIEAWGKQAEVIAKYLTKGRPLYVEGRLKQDQWEDKQSGQKRTRMKVVLESFQFLGGPRDDTQPAPAHAPAAAAPPQPKQSSLPGVQPDTTFDESDVPF
jgi:single-strand DNA-binding protein